MTTIDRNGKNSIDRIERRTSIPLQKILTYYRTFDFTNWIKEHLHFINDLINNPNNITNHRNNIFNQLKNRLILKGAIASFPEFRGIIAYLLKAIFQDERKLNKIFNFYNNFFKTSSFSRNHLNLSVEINLLHILDNFL